MKTYCLTATLCLLVLVSCRSHKGKGFFTKNKADTSNIKVPEIKSAVESAFDFDYLSYKANCDYKDDNMDQSFTMNIRMKKDSIIWISITTVGFEVARAKIDKDSVMLISRLEKKYYIYDYKYIEKLAGTQLNLGQIQSLLTANLVFPPFHYRPATEPNHFGTTEGYIETTVTLDSKYKIVEQIIQHMVEQSNASVVYSEFKKVDKQHFPGTVDIAITTPKRNIKLLLQNAGVSTSIIEAFPFEIPAKYERGN